METRLPLAWNKERFKLQYDWHDSAKVRTYKAGAVGSYPARFIIKIPLVRKAKGTFARRTRFSIKSSMLRSSFKFPIFLS